MLSVVIPTRNEERYIGKLLESLKKQNFNGLEIIVADADSEDKTREIAEDYGARITLGGLLPAIGRNNGIKIAKCRDILFLDADVILPEKFLRENYNEFIERDLDIATTFIKPLSKKFVDNSIYYIINKGYIFFEKKSPAAHGFNIFVKREWFDEIGGFDERIILNDDLDFVQRIWKAGGKFGVLHGPEIYVSVRRLKKEGRTKFILKGIYGILHYKIRGPMYPESKLSINYKFDGYDDIKD